MFTQKRLNASVPGGMRSTTERELPGERKQEVKVNFHYGRKVDESKGNRSSD